LDFGFWNLGFGIWILIFDFWNWNWELNEKMILFELLFLREG